MTDAEMLDSRMELRDRLLRAMKAGHRMPLRNCTMCDATLHYFVSAGQLYYQSSCDCTDYESAPQSRDIGDLNPYTRPDADISCRLSLWAESKGF